jgi:hypothetical protein
MGVKRPRARPHELECMNASAFIGPGSLALAAAAGLACALWYDAVKLLRRRYGIDAV